MKGSTRTMKEEIKLATEFNKYKRKCKCGHVVILIDNPYKICEFCGRPIFRDEKAKFMYKVGGIKCLH